MCDIWICIVYLCVFSCHHMSALVEPCRLVIVCVGVLLFQGFCLFVWLTMCGNAFDRVVSFLCRVVSCRVVSCRVVSVCVLVCCGVWVVSVDVVGCVVGVVLCGVVWFRVGSGRVVWCCVVFVVVCCSSSVSVVS